MSKWKLLFLITLCLHLNIEGIGQQPDFQITEIGTPFIDIYSPEQYGGSSQNWDILQDTKGHMYFANTDGVLIYDGQTWRRINNPNGNGVHSLCLCDDRLYVGMIGEVGYLDADEYGLLEFISLKDRLPKHDQNFTMLFEAQCNDGYVYFRSTDDTFIYDINQDSFTKNYHPDGFVGLTRVDSSIYIWKNEVGLVGYTGDSSKLILKAEDIVGRVVDIDRLDHSTYLITTRDNFYYWEYEKNKLIASSDINLPREVRLEQTIVIDGKYIISASLNQGILVFDRSGQLIQQYDKADGLPSNIIRAIKVDRDKNLWAATNNGIVSIHMNSPFTLLDQRHGLEGSLLHAIDYNNRWYVSGFSGLFAEKKVDSLHKFDLTFEQYDEVKRSAWVFIKRGDDLLLGAKSGLLQVFEDKTESIYQGDMIWSVLHSSDKNFLLGGTPGGKFHVFKKNNGQWRHSGVLNGIDNHNDFMEEESDGSIWLTDSGSGVFRFKLNNAQDSVTWLKSYQQTDGLPDVLGNRVYRHSSGLKFLTKAGVYNYDPSQDQFVKDEVFWPLLGADHAMRFVEVPGKGVLFAADSLGKGFLRKEDNGNYKLERDSFKKIESYSSEYVWAPDSNHVMIAGFKGLVHFNPNFKAKLTREFTTSVRSVHTIKPYDSLIFGGHNSYRPMLTFELNSIRLSYSASYYDESSSMLFQYRLKGFEDDWSEWSTANYKEYTNIPHGEFTFEVRAKNIYDQIGSTDAFSFEVFPPWYLTYWAYMIYGLLVMALITLIAYLYNRRLMLENLRLESVIQQRTEEITRQKDEALKDKRTIEQQATELKKLDKAKSMLFTNITHELKTPLTLINAPLSNLLDGGPSGFSKEVRQQLEIVRNGGESLRELIDEILDLSKLEAGKLEIKRNPVRLAEMLDIIVEPFYELARQREIDFDVDNKIPQELASMTDEAKVTKVLNNLISNALKFTPAGGKVNVIAEEHDESVRFIIRDNGPGIAEEDQERVFDRYYQATNGQSKALGGTGIGLAYAEELSKVLDGRLTLKSELGQGSEFVFEMKLSRTSFEEEITIDDEEILVDLNATFRQVVREYSALIGIGRPRVLIVEDHREMRIFISGLLNKHFDISMVENGARAKDILEQHPFDIIVSDVMMPVMDGIELLTWVKANDNLRATSMIMLTAKSAVQDKVHALTLGVDDYITKPFDRNELMARIKNILTNRTNRLKNNDGESLELVSADQQHVQAVERLVQEHIQDNRLSVSFLSEKMAISERQLQRKLKQISGLSPLQFIKEIRLTHARQLLESKTKSTVAEVAHACGFESVPTFSTQFINRFGKRPSSYL